MKIRIISVFVGNKTIEYCVTCENGKVERYNEQSVPCSVIRLMNYNKPILHYVKDGLETITYYFN